MEEKETHEKIFVMVIMASGIVHGHITYDGGNDDRITQDGDH